MIGGEDTYDHTRPLEVLWSGRGGAQAQRARILDALAQVVAECGYQGASVGLVVARARVSRRTFYEQFDGLEDCFAGVLDLGTRMGPAVIAQAFARQQDWRDGMREALAALLMFFDSEPALTKMWFGEVLAAGGWALEHRERDIAKVQSMIVEHWSSAASVRAEPVLARGVMGSVFDALTTHVVTAPPEPLITLLGPLMNLVVSPFLTGEAVTEQVERAEQLARELQSEHYPLTLHSRRGVLGATDAGSREVTALGAELPGMLANPSARRARLCMLFLADHPGASNYQVGAGIGIAHQSQTSKLLARLAEIGLLEKRPGTPGHPNAWTLTPAGEQVAQALVKY